MNRIARRQAVGRPADDAAWNVIVTRRSAPRGRPFFLVVTSTGIVCKPGCPARTPRRENVRIVPTVDVAIAAGARPCLRCRPSGAVARIDADEGRDGVAAAAAIASDVLSRLDRSLAEGETPPTDSELAGVHGVSERRMRAIVRDATGVTPRAWLAARRAERLRDGLAARQPVLDALLDAGYESSSSAYEAANAILGMAPARYREGGAGETVRWTVTVTALGWALIAATRRGLCAIKLGDDWNDLERELRAEFARAEIVRDDTGLALAAEIVADLAAGRQRSDVGSIPLDLAGTAFRRRVWEALRRIPAGETWTYQFLAAAVGAPKAARAVGSACATNPVALVLPCHRVVGSDGRMHGYRWGVDRKARLLDAEAQLAAHAGEAAGTEDAAQKVGSSRR